MNRKTHFPFSRKGFWICVGAVVGGVWLAVIVVVNAAFRPTAKPTVRPLVAEQVLTPQPSPSPAPKLKPAAEAAATPIAPPPPTAPPVVPSLAPPQWAKAKRPSHRPATDGSAKGAGAKSMAAARTAFSAGDYIASWIQSKRAVTQGAGVSAYLLMGNSLLRLESYEEARQAFKAALELDPGNAAAKSGLRAVKQKATY